MCRTNISNHSLQVPKRCRRVAKLSPRAAKAKAIIQIALAVLHLRNSRNTFKSPKNLMKRTRVGLRNKPNGKTQIKMKKLVAAQCQKLEPIEVEENDYCQDPWNLYMPESML